MLLNKTKEVILTQEQKQAQATQIIRANCNSLYNLALKLQSNLKDAANNNVNGLTRDDVIKGLKDDAASLPKFEDALTTFISAIENL